MQLVGATRAFILKPFIWRAVINGTSAALIASVLVYLLVVYAQKYYTEILIVNDYIIWLQLAGGLIAIGVVISVLSTFFAVNKWLRKSTGEIH